MQIDTLWRRWLDVLAATYFGYRDVWRAKRSLVITCKDDRFIIRAAATDSDRIIQPEQPFEGEDCPVAVLAAGERASNALSHAARRSVVILEVPSEHVVLRRVGVPAQARDFVAGIVRNQIDRLSPWPPEQAIYGFAIDVDSEDAATLDVCVLIAARTVTDGLRDQIAAIGLSVDRIVAPLFRGDSTAVILWSRLVDISPEQKTRLRRQIGIGIAAAVGASFALSLWAVISAQMIGGRNDEVAARISTLERQLQAPLTLRAVASLPPAQREWYAKETSPTAVIVIEALSRALPDTAYLTELSLQNTTLRIVGLTSDAPSLIAPLEHSGSLTNVHFFAPTTRESDGKKFRFHIESSVEPHATLAEDQH
ncbi:MAG TPA: PilN domain-containing protein [Xanthobacteraceae bacterium]|jgi:general secretion pathway protein L